MDLPPEQLQEMQNQEIENALANDRIVPGDVKELAKIVHIDKV